MGFAHEEVALSAGVQRMVRSDLACARGGARAVDFTVLDPAVAAQLNAVLGKRIALHYEEHRGISRVAMAKPIILWIGCRFWKIDGRYDLLIYFKKRH